MMNMKAIDMQQLQEVELRLHHQQTNLYMKG